MVVAVVMSKMKDFSGSQPVTYNGKVSISQKQC